MAKISPPLTIRQTWWLAAAALAALLPLFSFLPPWLIAAPLAAIAWRCWLSWGHRPLPPRWLLILIVIAGTVGVFFEYRHLFGRTPGMAMLVLFIALKLLELRSQRDAHVIVMLGCFLLLTSFFNSQTLPSTFLVIACLSFVIAPLASLQDPTRRPLRLWLRGAGLLAQAVPLMLVLYLLFPRIDGPLWGLPTDAFGATTGITDRITPGSIAQVARSDAIAFRVRFADTPPGNDDIYWRGPVLSQFDGQTWRTAPSRSGQQLPYAVSGPAIAYEVTQEASHARWLFALELPGELPPNSAISEDYQLLSRDLLRTRQRYSLRSYPTSQAGREDNPRLLREALYLPNYGNPRTRTLVQQWREDLLAHPPQGAPDLALLARAQDFFQRQQLTYTLNPPLLGKDAVDEFLFDSKRGFCEHFASAFVFAMRAAGVPARIVAGYQGGEVNPVDGLFTVRQSDAHAWAEVWLKGRGWVRVDPTALSSPLRIQRGLQQAVPADDPLPLLSRDEMGWLRDLRYHWEATSNAWNQWVQGYSQQRQREFLNEMGLTLNWSQIAFVMLGLCALCLLALAAWLMPWRRNTDPLPRLWHQFTQGLAQRGCMTKAWEGPLAFSTRAARHFPAEAGIIQSIAQNYAELRYGPPRSTAEEAAQLAALKQLVAQLKK